MEYEHLLLKDKVEEGDKLEDILNRNSAHKTQGFASAGINSVPLGSFVQFQRIGNFRVDGRFINDEGQTVTRVIFIPSGIVCEFCP